MNAAQRLVRRVRIRGDTKEQLKMMKILAVVFMILKKLGPFVIVSYKKNLPNKYYRRTFLIFYLITLIYILKSIVLKAIFIIYK